MPMSSIAAACAARGCAGVRMFTSVIHVAGFNLGVLMRALFGCGTPRGARGVSKAYLFVVQTDGALIIALIAEFDGESAMLLIVLAPEGA